MPLWVDFCNILYYANISQMWDVITQKYFSGTSYKHTPKLDVERKRKVKRK